MLTRAELGDNGLPERWSSCLEYETESLLFDYTMAAMRTWLTDWEP